MAKNKSFIKCGDVVIYPVKPEKEDFTIWDIKWDAYERIGDKRKVATLFFLGEPENGTVTLDFVVEEGFKFHSYIRQAVASMKDWALNQATVYEVECNVFREDEVKIDAVQRAGLIYRTHDKLVEHYSADKQRTAWTALYLIIGIVAGMILGVVFNSMVAGMIAGVFIGVVIGGILDGKANEERAKVTKHKYISHRINAKNRAEENDTEDKESEEELKEE